MGLIRKLAREHWPLLILILVSGTLRLYKAENLFVFSGDEEHQMSIAYSIIKHFHIEWVGVSSADTGFYLGPFWMYFGALWLFLSRGNPSILAYVAAVIGIITTLAVYFVGVKVFDKKAAIIATALYSTLPLFVYFDKKFWNPSLTSPTSLMLFFSLLRARTSPKWWLVVALTYGFAFHVHLSLIPLGLIIICFGARTIKRTGMKYALLAIIIFLSLISPLIAFDYFTNGRNILTPIRVYTQVQKRPERIDPGNHIREFMVTMSRFWYLYPGREISDEVLHGCSPEFLNKDKLITGLNTTSSPAIPILSFFSLGLLLVFVLHKTTWLKENTRLLAIFLVLLLACYILLPNIALEYYLLGFFPLFLYVPGLVLDMLNKPGKILLLIPLSLLLFTGIYTIFSAKDSFGLTNKKALIGKVANFVGEKTFDLDEEGLCHQFEGWRFLYRAYYKVPLNSSQDKSLGWIYSSEIGKEKGFYKIVMAETRAVANNNKREVAKFESGGFTAYIYKN